MWRPHRRDDDGLWSEQSAPRVTSPTLEPCAPRDLEPTEEDWRLRLVVWLVATLPVSWGRALTKVVALALGIALACGLLGF